MPYSSSFEIKNLFELVLIKIYVEIIFRFSLI